MNKQNGSALIISLLILLVMTMLGITSMSTSTLEEKMAANDRNQKITFQNTELTLRDAEDAEIADIISKNNWGEIQDKVKGSDNTGYYTLDDNIDYYDNANWVAGETCLAVANNQNGSTACYIVEFSPENPNNVNDEYLFLKITAKSTAANGNSNAIVQSMIRIIKPNGYGS